MSMCSMCNLENDGFGCSYAEGSKHFDPDRCISCLRSEIDLIIDDIVELIRNYKGGDYHYVEHDN